MGEGCLSALSFNAVAGWRVAAAAPSDSTILFHRRQGRQAEEKAYISTGVGCLGCGGDEEAEKSVVLSKSTWLDW